jgi:hypothetical protein
LRETGTPGIHFEDYPQLQGYELPEWSHASASEARRMTAQLAPLVEAAFLNGVGSAPRATPAAPAPAAAAPASPGK